ncbi:MAG: response regulator [Chloroflexi bacterium]|nr:response regulator [Chloroflexota bacterium]
MSKKYHVLVVEDEEYWREDVFREELEGAGYQVETSSSYGEAVAALDRRIFDLLVIDVNLTGQNGNQDGIRVLEQMVSLGHKSKAIVVSGSRTRAMAEQSVKKFQPIAFLDKTTFDVIKFITLVQSALK